jgi:hypothetical protein
MREITLMRIRPSKKIANATPGLLSNATASALAIALLGSAAEAFHVVVIST